MHHSFSILLFYEKFTKYVTGTGIELHVLKQEKEMCKKQTRPQLHLLVIVSDTYALYGVLSIPSRGSDDCIIKNSAVVKHMVHFYKK